MIENNDTDFPEPFRASKYNNEITLSDVFDFEETMVWFKRCLEDKPIYEIPRDTSSDSIKESWIVYLKKLEFWYFRWFSQFRNKGDI